MSEYSLFAHLILKVWRLIDGLMDFCLFFGTGWDGMISLYRGGGVELIFKSGLLGGTWEWTGLSFFFGMFVESKGDEVGSGLVWSRGEERSPDGKREREKGGGMNGKKSAIL